MKTLRMGGLVLVAACRLLAGCFAYPDEVLLHPNLPDECRDNAPAAVERLAEEKRRYLELHTGTGANLKRGRILVRWGFERCEEGGVFEGLAGEEIGRTGIAGRTRRSVVWLCRCDVFAIAHELGHATDLPHTNICGDLMDTPTDACVDAGAP